MRKTMIRLVCLILMLCAAVAAAEAPQGQDITALPQGMWILNTAGDWAFGLSVDTPLTAAQALLAQAGGLQAEEGFLRAGTAVPSGLLFSLFPGAEAYFQLPLRTPTLERFSLNGSWFYGEGGVLYYRHGEGYRDMTMDEVFAALEGTEPVQAAGKMFYLTIDDTPSSYTMELLAVLQRLNIKATFFVVGASVRKHPVFLRAIYEQGHTIANHSYSHNEASLTASYSSCLQDFLRCEQAVEDALGFPLEMPILRVPYGASTIPLEYRSALQREGYMWIDWNALNGDTESGIKSDEDALNRAITTASRNDGSIVMLVHDGKKRTIRTMEAMITYFREQGYAFGVLDVGMGKIEGVRSGFPK